MKSAMLLHGLGRNLPGRALLGMAVLFAMLGVSAGAWAAGPTGPLGPVGPTGPTRPSGVAGAQPVPPPALPVQPPAHGSNGNEAAPAGNHIEVTGNTATATRCPGEGAASVNSVDVAGARLQGRTVIVQGRNTHDVHTGDCPARTGLPTQGQTHSIRIR